MILELAAASRPDHRFAIASATPEEREELAAVAEGSWTGGARFLVATEPYEARAPGPRRLLIVCETAFRNVPRRLIPPAPTHAAAYSDGSVALISASEYAALDHSKLVPLDQLLADQTSLQQASRSPNHNGLESAKPDLQSLFKKPGGAAAPRRTRVTLPPGLAR
jgi:hypothetical protein